MKRLINLVMIFMMCLSLVACSKPNEIKEMTPQSSQMKAIFELATMNCYYHNVAKYVEENAEVFLWWKKDRRFWVEYSGVVTIGIDTSLVNIDIDGEVVTITIPSAEVLGCKVDETTLNKDSFIVENGSAEIDAIHQQEAYKQAQAKMEETAKKDKVLLANAQRRAQKLLEDYINNIGNAVDKQYQIKWIYLDDTVSQESEAEK